MHTLFVLSRPGRRALLLGLAGLLGARVAAAQVPPIRFGQPVEADFEARNFVADSGAAAVVLCDYGTSRFASKTGDMAIVHERLVRLKILKKAGYDYATVEVPLYHHDDDAESISGLKGFTYVRGADGKLVKTKLEVSGIFSEKRSDRVNVQKFTLPGVREGAVIEYTYTVTSSFLSDYPEWKFQRDIPVRWSEYRVSIPQAYRYNMLYFGYVPLAVNEESLGSVALALANRTQLGAGVGMETSTQLVTMSTNQRRWVVRDAPAVRPEPYMTTPDDYVARITFELAGTQWPNEQFRDLAESWPRKNKLLLEHQGFGQALGHGNFLKELVQPLVARHADPAARAAAVRELVLGGMKYDGTNRLLASNSLKQAWEQHRGTSADVNLLLLAALRQAGLPAEPLILSTRAHGLVSKEHPQLDQFNYVVALLPLADGQELLLDATEPLLPCGVLPPHCLTQQGHTVPAEGEGRWVSLVPVTRHTRYQEVKMTFDAQGALRSEVREERGGYASLEARTQLAELGEKKYVAALANQHPDGEVSAYQFAAAEASQPFSLRYTLRQPGAPAGTELYLRPLAAFGVQNNPFQLPERSFPVDFGMLQQEVISLTLSLPPGYVAELPKAATLALPNQGGRYVYVASSPAPGTVQLVSRLTLDKPVYSSQDYQALRELYRQLLAKQAEAIVVKKAGS